MQREPHEWSNPVPHGVSPASSFSGLNLTRTAMVLNMDRIPNGHFSSILSTAGTFTTRQEIACCEGQGSGCTRKATILLTGDKYICIDGNALGRSMMQ